jgi:hypothetical protein
LIDAKMRSSFQAREWVRLNLQGEAREGFLLDDPFMVLDISELQIDGGEVSGVIQGVIQFPGSSGVEGNGGLSPSPFGGVFRMMPGQIFLLPIEINKLTSEELGSLRASLASAPSGVARGLAESLGSLAFVNGETQLFLLLSLPLPRESN